jgi:hypothetical protein
MTRHSVSDPRTWIVLAVLVLTPITVGLYLGSATRNVTSAAGSDVPLGLVPGARVVAYIPAMTQHQQFTVDEVRGHWVLARANVVGGWQAGAQIWINLDSIQSMDVNPPRPETPKK